MSQFIVSRGKVIWILDLQAVILVFRLNSQQIIFTIANCPLQNRKGIAYKKSWIIKSTVYSYCHRLLV